MYRYDDLYTTFSCKLRFNFIINHLQFYQQEVNKKLQDSEAAKKAAEESVHNKENELKTAKDELENLKNNLETAKKVVQGVVTKKENEIKTANKEKE